MIPVTRIYLLYLQTVLIRAGPILGDPGAVSGGRESLNRREKNSRKEKSRTRIRALILVLDFSLREFFSRVFRLSLPPLTAPGSPRMSRRARRHETECK